MLWPLLSMIFAGTIIYIASSSSLLASSTIQALFIFFLVIVVLGTIVKKFLINKHDPLMKGFADNNKPKKNEPSLIKKIMVDEKRTEEIKQNLSDGSGMIDYEVGDRAYTMATDFMQDGEYKCYNTLGVNSIENVEVDNTTYDEKFIMLNTDKIVHKKELFAYQIIAEEWNMYRGND